ncbi:chromomethylase 1 [Hordeum vulgare]|nr:chromomethylase 1 [Hordeum vulgare]
MAAGDSEPEFLGEPVPTDEARAKWSQRYQHGSPKRCVSDLIFSLLFFSAGWLLCVDPCVVAAPGQARAGWGHEGARPLPLRQGDDMDYMLGDDVYVLVISRAKCVNDQTHDPKRVFLCEEKNDNPLDCIISKVKIIHVDPNTDSATKAKLVPGTDLYYDMSYSVAYSTFANIPSAIWQHTCTKRLIKNDVFKQDWRAEGRGHILRYFALKWALCFLVGALTATAAFVANLGVENVADTKFVVTSYRTFARR